MTEKPKSTQLLLQLSSGQPAPRFTGKRRGELENFDLLLQPPSGQRVVQSGGIPGQNGTRLPASQPTVRSVIANGLTNGHNNRSWDAAVETRCAPQNGDFLAESEHRTEQNRDGSHHVGGQVRNYSTAQGYYIHNHANQTPIHLLEKPIGAGILTIQTQQLLQRLSTLPMDIGNRRDLSSEATEELVKHLAPEARFRFDNGDRGLTFDEQMKDWSHFLKLHPEYYNVVREASVHASRGQNEAVVLISCHVRGVERVEMEAFAEAKWRWDGRMWLLYSWISMRSSSENTGFVFG